MQASNGKGNFVVESRYIKFLLLILSLITGLFAQDDEQIYNLDEEIIVTASQIPTAFSDVARSVIVLSRVDIENLPVQTVQDAIEYLSGVDMQQRGPNGIQSDVSIRGATYEQTLVLIDGVKISDAQTGHHNMNIPLTLLDIEKIEVLKGPGSKQFGPNALGGVINIITKHSNEMGISFYETFGQHNYYDAGATLFLPVATVRNRLSVHKTGSDGYRDNTDFSAYTISFGSRTKLTQKNEIDIFAGLNKKRFGANGFYSANFPNQWEQTKTIFFKTGWNYKAENYWFNTRFNFRANDDEFLLDRDNPDFYHNQHQTNSGGVDFQAGLNSFLGITSIGAEFSNEAITSNNLGNHERKKAGMFVEHQIEKERFRLIIAGSLYRISDWGWNMWPGLDMGFNISANMRLYGSVGRAFRIPTFTELYYKDLEKSGNADLKEESAWIYEAGYAYSGSKLRINAAVFQRDSEQLIDWVRQMNDEIWLAQNLSSVRTRGFELSCNYRPKYKGFLSSVKRFNMNYTYLGADRDLQGLASKYALCYLRHHLVAGIEHSFFYPSLQFAWKLRWEDRLLYDAHFITDLRLNWKIKNARLHIDVTNLFNLNYEDYFHIPLPGRWFKMGVRFELK